ncbi:MAG: WD40 repeat domain-containing protein, partial [Anaerolineae bacterium]|nr:WD40 repeat domain-containing protein [Anaerolineae bacterium]
MQRLIPWLTLLAILAAGPSVQAQDPIHEVARLGRGTATALSWHPDGDVLAVGSSTGVWLLDAALSITGHHASIEHVADVAWSPDGSQIAITGTTNDECHIQLWNTALTDLRADHGLCGRHLLWSPDGARLAVFDQEQANTLWPGVTRGEGNTWMVAAINGELIATLIGHTGGWTSDGMHLITCAVRRRSPETEPGLYTWDALTDEQVRRTDGSFYDCWRFLETNSADSVTGLCLERLADDSLVNYLCERNTVTGELTLGMELPDNSNLYALQRNHDHSLLAAVSWQPSRFLNTIAVMDIETQEVRNVGNGEDFIWQPAADVVTSIVGNGLIQYIDALTGEVLNEANLFTAPVTSVDWRPDSSQIASSGYGEGQFIRVWETTEPTYEPVLSWRFEPAHSVAYTPNGSELVTWGASLYGTVCSAITAWNPDTGERSRAIDSFYDQFEEPPIIGWNNDFTRAAYERTYEEIQI